MSAKNEVKKGHPKLSTIKFSFKSTKNFFFFCILMPLNMQNIFKNGKY